MCVAVWHTRSTLRPCSCLCLMAPSSCGTLICHLPQLMQLSSCQCCNTAPASSTDHTCGFFCSRAALSILLFQLQLIVLVRAAPSLCHSSAPAGCSSTRSLPLYQLCDYLYLQVLRCHTCPVTLLAAWTCIYWTASFALHALIAFQAVNSGHQSKSQGSAFFQCRYASVQRHHSCCECNVQAFVVHEHLTVKHLQVCFLF